MDGAPKFTYDFIMGNLRITLVAVLAFAGGKGWLTPTDAGAITAIATGLGPLVIPWICSVYANLGVVHVASGSAAATLAKVEAVAPVAAANAANKVADTVIKVLVAAVLLSGFLFTPPAMAAGRHHAKPHLGIVMQVRDPIRQLGDKIRQDVTTNAISRIQDQTNPASNALQELSDFISGDVANAADLAISIPDMTDGNGQICLDEMKKASTIFQANPVPTVTDKQGIASALERIRLLAMTANRICQLPACTQVFADASGALAQLMPIKMPAVPNVHDICSLIPTVAVAKPTRTLATAVPASTPAAAPSQGNPALGAGPLNPASTSPIVAPSPIDTTAPK